MSSLNCVYHLHKSCSSITEKRPQRPETCIIKDGFEKMEREFPFGTFRSLPLFPLHAPRDFSQERPKKSCFIYFPTGSYGFFLLMVKNRSNVSQLPCHVLFLTKGLFIRYFFFYPQRISHRAIFHLRSEKSLLF